MEVPFLVRIVGFFLLFFLFWCSSAAVNNVGETDEKSLEEINFCSPEVAQRKTNSYVFVSTMDGKVSALNLEDGGEESWSIETGPGPMLSSSIHNLELSNNGQWVRMIPSLNGGLYKMNGKSVEAVPITAEHLLKSSFRYTDDIVISGGIETRTYGVDSATGKLLYECSMSSCDNHTVPGQRPASSGKVILIQRQTQTVRAIEPRDGTERWNFSVGQHDVKISPDPSAACNNQFSSSMDDVILKVIVPDGLVCALDPTGTVIWKHKFDYPVVNAWRTGQSGDLKLVDLFGGTRTPEEKIYLPESPILYIGMHNKQLYIQESVRLRNKVLESVDRLRHHLVTDNQLPSIPWRPIPAKVHILGIEGSSEPILQITDEGHSLSTLEDQKTTGLSVLYASEYVNGQGFYLLAPTDQHAISCKNGNCNSNDHLNSKKGAVDDDQTTQNISDFLESDDSTIIEEFDLDTPEEEETPVQVIIVSFWYWWKEVMLTSIFTAIIVNLIIQRRFISILYSGRLSELNNLGSSQEESTKTTCVTASTNSGNSNNNIPFLTPTAEYVSRYLTDFEPIRRLGCGGFGIVFQAKNKMDDCEYAVKRIPLPNKEEALERMKREVKALAKLDHQNIVRYFNSWVEEPPPGWQESTDNLLLRGSEDLLSGDVNIDLSGVVTPTSEDLPSFSKATSDSSSVRKRNVFKSLWDKASYAISYRSESSDKDLVLPRPTDDASNSFIVFENSKSNKNDSSISSLRSTNGTNSVSHSVSNANFKGNISTDITDVSRFNMNEGRKRDRGNRKAITLDLGSSDGSIPLPRQRKFLYIQMQLCQRDSLKDWLLSNQIREKQKVLNIFDQIVSAVDYVHFQGLIHRDLKPSNIFFSYDGQIKVGDFGLVTTMSEEDGVPGQRSPLFVNGVFNHCHTAHVGTHLYMSPEQLAGRQYDYKVDIFSLGVIFFELLTAFSTEMERAKALSAVRRLKFPDNFEDQSPEEAALLRLMLCDDPDSRLTTIGVRSRPPLRQLSSSEATPEDAPSADCHFTLPHRTRLRPSTSE